MPRPQGSEQSIRLEKVDDLVIHHHLHRAGRGWLCSREAASRGGLCQMDRATHEPRTHQQHGKKRNPQEREQRHPQASPKCEPLAIYPLVEDPAALRWWVEVGERHFNCTSFFLFRLLQDAPPWVLCFTAAASSVGRLPLCSIR